MANDVFANNREISCKSGAGKSICAFPDVCFTPPENPATPPGVPIPYPNTGLASDTTKGSKKTKISNKEIMLKNKSYFKKSMGDEAGCAAKKGVITSVHRGKVYFIMWSMDVKIEGDNAVRHLDMTTHNHASPTPNTPPMAHIDMMAFGVPASCEGMQERVQDECVDKGGSSMGADGRVASCSPECAEAQKCLLPPKKIDKQWCCPPENTGHHLIEDQWVKRNANFPNYRSFRGLTNAQKRQVRAELRSNPALGSEHDAPTVCANRFRSVGTTHRVLHDVQGIFVESYQAGGARHGQTFNYGAARNCAINSHEAAFSTNSCDRKCLEDQLDAFYGDDTSRPMNTPTERQDLGDEREGLQDSWGGVVSGEAEGLTQSLGDLLRAVNVG